jgi:plastocyanin
MNRFLFPSVSLANDVKDLKEGVDVKRRMRWVPAIALVTALAIMPAASGATVIRGVSTSNGFRWKPKITNVSQGTKVVWKAITGTHTVTAYSNNWSKNTTISAGEKTSFTFKKTGTFKFRCTFHSTLSGGKCSGMCGKVVVG